MKKYSKTEAIKIMSEAAKAYDEKLRGKCFLLCYEMNGSKRFSEIGFQAQNFMHFTGVRCNSCTAKQFYSRLLSGKLSERDFEFDSHGNTHRKLAVLPLLPHLFSMPLMCGPFINSGIYISADYYIGRTRAMISLGVRQGKSSDIPVSLYYEDIRKLCHRPGRVLAVWEHEYGDQNYSPCYCSNSVNAQALLSEYMGASAHAL